MACCTNESVKLDKTLVQTIQYYTILYLLPYTWIGNYGPESQSLISDIQISYE